jgi:hypothetical protein
VVGLPPEAQLEVLQEAELALALEVLELEDHKLQELVAPGVQVLALVRALAVVELVPVAR